MYSSVVESTGIVNVASRGKNKHEICSSACFWLHSKPVVLNFDCFLREHEEQKKDSRRPPSPFLRVLFRRLVFFPGFF